MTALRFFWNGIKTNGGKLDLCRFDGHSLINYPAGTITINKRNHSPFSPEVRAAFTVQNESDGMTDYFEKDHIRVVPTHPLYAQVADALAKFNAHYDKRFGKVGA